MSEETASTAVVETGGGSSSPSTSSEPSPSSSGTSGESSTPFSYNKVTDDQILDDLDGGEDEEAAAGKAPAQAAKSVPDPKAEEAPKADDAPISEVIEPEELKAVFKQHPSLRDSFYREKAYQEVFPTVAEARAMKEVFPTTDMARQAAQHQATLMDVDRLYQANPTEFVAKLHDGNPGAFKSMLEAIRPSLYHQNPEMYREVVAKPMVNDVLANLHDHALQSQDEELQAALRILDSRLGLSKQAERQGIAAQDPRVRAYDAMQAQGKQLAEQNYQAFRAGVEDRYWGGLQQHVEKLVGKPSAMPDIAVKTIISQVLEDITGAMASRRDLSNTYENLLRSTDISDKKKGEVADYLLQYAKHVAPGKIKARMDAWTKEFVAKNAEELEKKAAVPVKKDIGSGGAAAPKSTPKKINYRTMSDNDIMDM